MKVYEIVLKGFDGSTDKTDNKIMWVASKYPLHKTPGNTAVLSIEETNINPKDRGVDLVIESSDKIYKFDIYQPGEKAAGIQCFEDTIRIEVESGDPGGISGEFRDHMKQALIEWYDGAKVTFVP